jgi:hypothetical protein
LLLREYNSRIPMRTPLSFRKKESDMASKKSSVPPITNTTQTFIASPEATQLTTSPDELKKRFGPQQIPLAADFAHLIDMADIGSRAIGQASDQDGSPGVGLALDDGKLKVNNGNGLTTSGKQLTAQANNAKAIVVEAAGIGVNAGNGLVTSGNQLMAKANNAKAIAVEAAGIGVNAGNGLVTSGNQLMAKANNAKAIVVDSDGIGINAGVGLATINSLIVAKANTSMGINVSSSGIGLADNAWEIMMAKAYGATMIARSNLFTAFCQASAQWSCIHLVPKNNHFPIASPAHLPYNISFPINLYWGHPATFITGIPNNIVIATGLAINRMITPGESISIHVVSMPNRILENITIAHFQQL